MIVCSFRDVNIINTMCSESFPKEFEKTTEVLPYTNYGLSSIQEFKESEKEIHNLERLKNAGLTADEINMYMENGAGLLEQRKIESNVMNEQLEAIHRKIKLAGEIKNKEDAQPGSSNDPILNSNKDQSHIKFYPEGHPMNNIKDIEEKLFSHLQDDMLPITKRRKVLRRLERKKERILSQENQINIGTIENTSTVDRPGSLWDIKDMPHKLPKERPQDKQFIGPKKPTMYTVKDNKIVRLEPVNQERQEEYRAVDIVIPENDAEAQLLEGTKMCVDDIKKIEAFKDYEPGVPSKTLYLKNIAPSVTQDQLSLLFNQFLLENGGPIDVRLMTGRMRGQAFVSFLTKDLAIQALEETNGTILSGRPIIAQFGRNTNRIQHDNDDINDNR